MIRNYILQLSKLNTITNAKEKEEIDRIDLNCDNVGSMNFTLGKKRDLACAYE